MDLIDISRPLREGVPVWPGDTRFSFELAWAREQGGSVNVGRLTMSTHTGTHADAPFHFRDGGRRISELDLGAFLGPVRVIEVSGETSVGADELREHNLEGISRLLLRTRSWPDHGAFPERICHLRPDIAPFLTDKGVILVGVDAPSVDPMDSKELNAHNMLLERGIYVLEGLALDGVEPGDYELIALPLPLREADASPVRAVLLRR